MADWIPLSPKILATDWDQADPATAYRGPRQPEQRRCAECWDPIQPGPRAGRYAFCSARCRSRFRSRQWRRQHGDEVRQAKRSAYAADPDPVRAAATRYRASKSAESDARRRSWSSAGS